MVGVQGGVLGGTLLGFDEGKAEKVIGRSCAVAPTAVSAKKYKTATPVRCFLCY